MSGYLRRLATTGAAYTASSVLSKLIAVLLLPLYTQYLTPADYGAAEVMITGVIAASIVVRLGVIEALMRFYYLGGERPDEVVRTGFASLFWTATAVSAVLLLFAEPISEALLDRSDPELARIAIGGLWLFTLYEYLVSLFRLDERARAYFAFTIANVLLAIPLTVYLVVVEEERPGCCSAPTQPRSRSSSGSRSSSDGASRSSPTRGCCGGCSASGSRRCPPSCRSTPSTSSTGS
jgi:O-antigen/teichoic acid export membrane protein